MTAEILAFPAAPAQAAPKPQAALTRRWADQHLPLIDAALDLLGADNDEFKRRCEVIAQTEGPSVLEQLTAQLDRLGAHIGDVMEALAMTAMRIRTTMATGGAGA